MIGLGVVPPTVAMLKTKAEVSHTLANAKSIRIEHYHEYLEEVSREGDKIHTARREQIFDSRELPLSEIGRLEEAFPIVPDLAFPLLETGCLFDPHHRIIITDEEGMVTTILVCFECDHVAIAHGDEKYPHPIGTPWVWMGTLRHFFADEGMPNSPELYQPNFVSQPQAVQAPATSK